MIDFEQCSVASMLIIIGGAIRTMERYYFYFQFEGGGGPGGPYIESRGTKISGEDDVI